MAHKKEVVENHRDIVKKLEDSVMKLNKEFKVPVTPKLHIIFEKAGEYLLRAIKHFNSYNLGKTN